MQAPHSFQNAVRLWGWRHGTDAWLSWNTLLKCWVIELALKDDDPRMKAWQAGEVKRRPSDSVPLQRRNKSGHLVGIELEELGVSGLERLLDEGNVRSGTGKYPSLMQAVRAVQDENDRLEQQMEKAAVEAGMETADRYKRQILEGLGHSLPRVTVPTTIS